MAQLPGTFNPDEIPDDDELLPAGKYLAQVIESEIVPTKDGRGQILKLTFEIMSGQYERRRIWERMNIMNHSETAQRIANQQLARLCKAAGLGIIDDSEELHFRPVTIEVGAKVDETGRYRDQNVIKRFYPANASNAEAAPPAAARQPHPARAATAPTPASAPPPAAASTAARPARPWG